MKEKVTKSQRTGLVMDCTDFVVLVFLLMACGTTMVFAYGTQELNQRCQLVNDCNQIGYFCAANRTCQCRPGYIPSPDWTKCIGYVNSKCFFDEHCIQGAYCVGSEGYEACKCRKQLNYYPSEDGKTCTDAAVSTHNQSYSLSLLLTLLWTSLYLNT